MIARDNPFSTDRVHRIRYRMAETAWDGLLERLEETRRRGEIVGPEGSGKTTLLEDLGKRLERHSFRVILRRFDPLRPDRTGRTAREIAGDLTYDTVVLYDGADSLGRIAWWALLHATRDSAGLVATTHRAGLLPTLMECTTSPELAEDLVRQLVGDEADRLRPLTRRLFELRQGNLREILRDLYDLYAAHPEAGREGAGAGIEPVHGLG
jgi:hypothetical protein